MVETRIAPRYRVAKAAQIDYGGRDCRRVGYHQSGIDGVSDVNGRASRGEGHLEIEGDKGLVFNDEHMLASKHGSSLADHPNCRDLLAHSARIEFGAPGISPTGSRRPNSTASKSPLRLGQLPIHKTPANAMRHCLSTVATDLLNGLRGRVSAQVPKERVPVPDE